MKTFARILFVLSVLFAASHTLDNHFIALSEAHAQISAKKKHHFLPEPSTLILLSAGLAGVGVYKVFSCKKSRKQ